MSRQGGGLQTPPLFLTQGQYKQLERSFTDPLQHQITALRLEITGLEADRDYWKTTAEQFDQMIQGYEEQAQEYRDTITDLQSQIDDMNRTITQQTQQITALQTRIAELEGQAPFPSNYAIITNNRQFTTTAILWFSFEGGFTGNYIATYQNNTDLTWNYIRIPAGTETALVVFNSQTHGFSLFTDGAKYGEDVTDVGTIAVQYNATTNNRILALY